MDTPRVSQHVLVVSRTPAAVVDRSGDPLLRSLGELEIRIMRVLWRQNEPQAIKEIVQALSTHRPPAHTTVITVAERLRAKGWVMREKRGRSFHYHALISADEYSAHLLREVLGEAEDRPAALLRFAGELDSDEAAALRTALMTTQQHGQRHARHGSASGSPETRR